MLTPKQQTELAARLTATMRPLMGLVNVVDVKEASVCAAEAIKELINLDKFIEGCKEATETVSNEGGAK